MNINKQDLFLNRTSLHSMAFPWGFHFDHCEASLRDSYGVAFHIDSAWDSRYAGHFSYLPFQSHLALCDYSLEPAFIRKRNERERQRVRCVNEGYTRLRQHLPQYLAEKRLSKVETLRAAIRYIKRLQGLLDLESLRSSLEDDQSHPHLSDHTTQERGPSGLYVSPPDSPQKDCLSKHQNALQTPTRSNHSQRTPEFSF